MCSFHLRVITGSAAVLQAQLHSLWVAQKNEERRRQEAEAAAKLRRLPEWYLRDQGKRQGSNAQDFAAW